MMHQYDITLADFRRAQKLYYRSRRGARVRFILWMYGLPLTASALLAVDLYGRRIRPANSFDPWLSLTFFFIWMSIWIAALRPWHLRRCFKKSLPHGETQKIPTEIGFDDGGIMSGVRGRSEARFFWNAILDFAQDDAMTLLFIDKKKFLYVPRRAMNAESWDQLHSHLQEHRIPRAH